jgi:hypothetical protein
MRRRVAAVALSVTAALAAAGCTSPPGGVDGDLVDDWKPMAEAAAFVPEVGVCHATVVESGYLANYRPVDCAGSHMTQTAYVGTFTGPAAESKAPVQPGSAEYKTAFDDCDKRATAFLGGNWRTARLTLTLVLSSPEAWAGGTRWYRCDVAEVQSLDDTSLTPRSGSLKGILAKPSPLSHTCFNPRLSGDEVEEMVPVACSTRHRSEFVGIYTAKESTYQAFRANDRRTHEGCLAVVASYAKIPKDGNLQYRAGTIYYFPQEDEWIRGNRGIKCFLWRSDRTFTKSVKNGGTRMLPVG